ncbi:HEAT repeat domain-containing protein [Candidatus Micrarchaeota archaeon]|nr:HEAT repeat domain-containing protein [Candidatus Micrarchaeota archaeon]
MDKASGCPKEIAHSPSAKHAAKPVRDGFEKEGPLVELGSGRKREMPKLVRMDREGCLGQALVICTSKGFGKLCGRELMAAGMVETIECVLHDSQDIDVFHVLELTEFARETDDETLGRLLEFEGYEGRARDAIFDVLLALACHPNPDTREGAYDVLGASGKPEALEFLLERAKEERGPLVKVLTAIANIAKKMPQEKEKIVERLEPLLSDAGSSVRKETALMFVDFTDRSKILVLKMLAGEQDGDVAMVLFEHIPIAGSHDHSRYAGCIAMAINRHISKNPEIASAFFNRVAPKTDMEKLVGKLTLESRRLLAELGRPDGRFAFGYIVAYEHFMAACEGRLIGAEVMGNRFKYFLLPSERMGDTPGRVNERAIAVSEDVPERLRPIVAYHEYVEGQTGSHKKAKRAEIKAVRSLGLEQEYVEWLREMGPKVRKPEEFEGAFR